MAFVLGMIAGALLLWLAISIYAGLSGRWS
jgi:hypothetical protein